MTKYLFALSLLITFSFIKAQEPITDFYTFANKDWLDNTILTNKQTVVNNWGILCSEIMNQSQEILSESKYYKLNSSDIYTLTQLRNYYKSTSASIKSDYKRVNLIQENFPMVFGVLFSKITLSDERLFFFESLITKMKLPTESGRGIIFEIVFCFATSHGE